MPYKDPEKSKAQKARWNAANAEKVAAYKQAWLERNREKAAASVRKWQENNVDRLRARARERYAENPEKGREICRAKRKADIERHNAYARAHYAKHATKIKKLWRERRDADPERHNARVSKWRKANPEVAVAGNNRRRARLMGAPGGGLTLSEWGEIREVFDGRCAYCLEVSKKLERDHFQPLVRGGADSSDNIVPACKRCNTSKGSKSILQWMLDRC